MILRDIITAFIYLGKKCEFRTVFCIAVELFEQKKTLSFFQRNFTISAIFIDYIYVCACLYVCIYTLSIYI